MNTIRTAKGEAAFWVCGKCGHQYNVRAQADACCNKDTDLVTVCAECGQASCWQGIFMCEESQCADIKQVTRAELYKLGLENPDYWKTDAQLTFESGRQAERIQQLQTDWAKVAIEQFKVAVEVPKKRQAVQQNAAKK